MESLEVYPLSPVDNVAGFSREHGGCNVCCVCARMYMWVCTCVCVCVCLDVCTCACVRWDAKSIDQTLLITSQLSTCMYADCVTGVTDTSSWDSWAARSQRSKVITMVLKMKLMELDGVKENGNK